MLWRDAYDFAALSCAILLDQRGDYVKALRTLDLALMLGSQSLRDEMDILIAALQAKLPSLPPPQVAPVVSAPPPQYMQPIRPIAVRRLPSLLEFQALMRAETPVVLDGLLDDWPALARWADPGYLKRAAGYRTVPVETGRDYAAEGAGSTLMTLGEYVDRVYGGDAAELYLAQHTLFDQIAQLRADVVTPLYCVLSVPEAGVREGADEAEGAENRNAGEDREEDENEVRMNAWFGPAGTVSRLHYDVPHNILCQVVGRKYVRLYHRRDTAALYSHGSGMLHNTSAVDLDAVDSARFPLFAAAPFLDYVLLPGQALYIPPRHWHYVRSLDISFSVSFWWGASPEKVQL